MGTNGHLFIGDRGKIVSDRRSYVLIPEKRQKEYGNPPKKLPRSVGHYQEWIDACKGGQPGGSNFDWAGPLTEVVLLGNVATEPHRAKEWTIAAFATMIGALVISVATRGGVGMGDVKLGFLLGAGLGWNIVGAIVLAMSATFVVALAILARRGLGARKETIPFGPFLVFGALSPSSSPSQQR